MKYGEKRHLRIKLLLMFMWDIYFNNYEVYFTFLATYNN